MRKRFVITGVYDIREATQYFKRDDLITLQQAFALAKGPFPIVGEWIQCGMRFPTFYMPNALSIVRDMKVSHNQGKYPDERDNGVISHWEIEYNEEDIAAIDGVLASLEACKEAFEWYGKQPEEVQRKIDILVNARSAVYAGGGPGG